MKNIVNNKQSKSVNVMKEFTRMFLFRYMIFRNGILLLLLL